MKAILIKNELWSSVNGENKQPEDQIDPAAWEALDQKALPDLLLAIEPLELCHMRYINGTRDFRICYEKAGNLGKDRQTQIEDQQLLIGDRIQNIRSNLPKLQ